MTDWPKFTRGGYTLAEDGTFVDPKDEDAPPVRSRLMRVTGILDWSIKGDGFGAMPYYGANLFSEFLFGDLEEEVREGIMAVWKESKLDPNKKLKSDAYRGTQAHMLFEHLCQGTTTIEALAPQFDGYFIKGQDGLKVLATSYDAGACEAYHDIFQYFEPSEILSEQRVYWTEHPIEECPDAVCQHGYAGTLDALIQRIMIDMKTNKGDARWAAYPQMAMYGRAALQRGLIDSPIEKQIVVIPRPTRNDEGKMYDIFDDKFAGDEIVDPILEIYKQRRAWGPR